MNRYKYPQLKLCKPDRTGQGYISGFTNLKIKLNFNYLDDLSFEIYWQLDGKENPIYANILGGKVLFAEHFGYFIITDSKVEGNGIYEKRMVTAVSAESELARNKLSRIEQTIKLYNPLNPNDESTMLGFFTKHNPKWKIGTVDSELWAVHRTFDVQTTDWYNFLIGEVEKKYMCIFKFDTVNRIIHCHTVEGATNKTNIYVSYDNLIDNISIEEKYNEVFTALSCNGADYLDIRGVNPLGTNIIYNFNYFKNTEWITIELIKKLDVWEEKIKIYQPQYRDILTKLREQQLDLTTKETELVELKSSLAAVEQALAAVMSSNLQDRYSALATEKNQLQSKISEQETRISQIIPTIEDTKSQMKSINDALSFSNNFTADEIAKIEDITILDNYHNDGFKKTDIMTPYEIQDESQQLYDYSLKILDSVCQPKYYFSADLVNFIFLKEYEKFTKQADVGSIITAEIKKGFRTNVVLLSISLDFDDPTNFEMEFSNRHRLDNGKFEFNDLFTDTSYSSSSYNWDKAIISDPIKSGKMHEVTDFINGNFDAAKNSLMTAKGIGMVFDGSGLHGRRHADGVLQPHELWMTDNMLAMSDDNFNSPPKIALGRFKLPNSENYGYGINGEFIAGRLVVGNQFIFEAENGSFKFDGAGASLYNTTFEVIDEKNMRRTLIDPNNGFKIQGRANPNRPWEDKIFLDNDGNAVFIGKMTADSGYIGGFRIGKDGIFNDNNGDYWKSDGTGKFGLMTYNQGSATFDGNIYARNLRAGSGNGWIGNTHMQENTIDGEKMLDSSITGMKLSAEYKDSVVSAIASVEVKADASGASVTSLTNYVGGGTKNADGSIDFANSNTLIKQISNASYSAIIQSTQYTNDHAISKTEFKQYSDSTSADISLVVSYGGGNGRQVNIAEIVASANRSCSSIMLKADKIDMYGATNFISNMVDGINRGRTTINGGMITTGSISSNQISSGYVYAGYISADKISGGTIDAGRITVKNLSASNITSGYINADRISGGTISGSRLRSSSGSYTVDINGGQIVFGNNSYINGYSNDLYLTSYGTLHLRVSNYDKIELGQSDIWVYNPLWCNNSVGAAKGFIVNGNYGITGQYVFAPNTTRYITITGGIITNIR